MLIKGTVVSRKFIINNFSGKKWWVSVKLKYEKITVSGTVDSLPNLGDFAIASGKLESSRYGDQIKSKHIIFLDPQTPDAITERLLLFDVLTPNEIKLFVGKYGKNIWEKIEQKELELPKDKSDKLYTAYLPWCHERSIKAKAMIDLMKFGEEYEITFDQTSLERMITAYQNPVERLKDDFLSMVGLIEWETVSILADKLNIPLDIRHQAGLLNQMLVDAEEGMHLGLPYRRNQLLETLETKNRVRFDKNLWYFVPAKDCHFPVDEEGFIFLPPGGNYEVESEVARRIKYLMSKNELETPLADDKTVIKLAEEFNLCHEQIVALHRFVHEKISLITGGPGTGKSLMIATMAKLCQLSGIRFNLMAPTGTAAKRITQLTGYKASTIHRFLFGLSKESTDVLIVDESSMIDAHLLHALMISGLFNRIVFLGDSNQLKPVGYGNPFQQMLLSNNLPCTTLIKTWRFDAGSSGIERAMKMVLNGENNIDDVGQGFNLILTNDCEKEMLALANQLQKFRPSDDRFMTPTNKTSTNGNQLLRPILAPEVNLDETFSVGDWVRQTKNDYDLNVFRGEVGQIKKIHEVPKVHKFLLDGVEQKEIVRKPEIIVAFDDREITFNSFGNMTHSYIGTVHLSQGGESQHSTLILGYDTRINTRQLLYTAISRAKNTSTVISNRDVLNKCIQRTEPIRYSRLKQMLEE